MLAVVASAVVAAAAVAAVALVAAPAAVSLAVASFSCRRYTIVVVVAAAAAAAAVAAAAAAVVALVVALAAAAVPVAAAPAAVVPVAAAPAAAALVAPAVAPVEQRPGQLVSAVAEVYWVAGPYADAGVVIGDSSGRKLCHTYRTRGILCGSCRLCDAVDAATSRASVRNRDRSLDRDAASVSAPRPPAVTSAWRRAYD
jgi:hypothetical protein